MTHSSPTATHGSAAHTKATSTAGLATGEHWYELTATLSRQSRDEFGVWLSEELHGLELELSHFSTPNSRQEVKRQR